MRRTLVAVLAAASLGLVACGTDSGPETASESETINVTIAQAGDFLGFSSLYVAQQKGFFRDNKLNVTIVKSSGGPQVMAAVLAGQAQFSTSTVGEIFNAWAQGQKVQVIAPFAHQSNVVCGISPTVLSRLNIPAGATWQDKARALKGLKIGVTSAAGSVALTAKYMLKNAGLNPDTDMQITAIGVDSAAWVAAMKQGQIDAMCSGIPIPEAVIATGAAVEFLSPAKGEVPVLAGMTDQTLSTTADWASKNPQAVQRLVKSIAQAQEFIKNSPDEAATVVKQAGFANLDDAAFKAGFADIKIGLNTCPIMAENSFNVSKSFYTFALAKEIPVSYADIYNPAVSSALTCKADQQ